MRPIERKVFSRISKSGVTFYDVEEVVDGASKSELKKSYPDDCLFQKPRYFAKSILDALYRNRLIEKRDGKFYKIEKKDTKKEGSSEKS